MTSPFRLRGLAVDHFMKRVHQFKKRPYRYFYCNIGIIAPAHGVESESHSEKGAGGRDLRVFWGIAAQLSGGICKRLQ
ncbi:TPA: hypothetical protein ACXJQO_000166 [Serratia marcescens]|uniref:hypothetical protein n=1 Tax=Serratia TaxID=613 RepID=UPI0018D70734|nr:MULTISPECIES: hypothetical protein [Serratia]MBH2655679.1 hypothetical protein [Serratia ureilytica]MBH2883483.1 hypothetical protein [Serratia ureilytica]MBH2924415.1 hypothetical protein [Serratia ureilytica]MDP8636594.1 hypothetical protein [Serratia marcescens]MDP8870094.1 hypothetical protein [Serratia marcescens]